MSKEEEIARLEEEIRTTPYNKATQHHIGRLKAKLARLREDAKKGRASKGHGFFIKKAGDASVAIVGPPSVGKSTLLNRLTNASSPVGSYTFTTTDVIPGIMDYEGFQIQMLDLPGLIRGAAAGRGRGREIIAMARVVDLLVILIDVYTTDKLPLIAEELYRSGIRLNRRRPDVHIKKKDRGGITVEISKRGRMEPDTAKAILGEYMSNADVVIRDDVADEELIDAILDNRVYLPAVVAVNKIDRKPADVRTDMDVVMISAKGGTGLADLQELIVRKLDLIRVYLKPEGGAVEERPMVLRGGATVEDVCAKLHRDFVAKFKYAVLNGPSAMFPDQRVGLGHLVADGDILTVLTR
jgi:hypothetical protein